MKEVKQIVCEENKKEKNVGVDGIGGKKAISTKEEKVSFKIDGN